MTDRPSKTERWLNLLAFLLDRHYPASREEILSQVSDYSEDWVGGINRLWSAEMLLHATDGSEATLLTDRAPVAGTADPGKTWLLTIRELLVLRHMYLMHALIDVDAGQRDIRRNSAQNLRVGCTLG